VVYAQLRIIKFKSGQENGKYLVNYFSRKLSKIEPSTPEDIYKIIQKTCMQDGTILEPFTWTGTIALATAKLGYRYIGLAHNPDIYSDLQKMVEFLGLKNVNIQYGELSDVKGLNPDLIMVSIPGLSVKIGEVMTTKKWIKGLFDSVGLFARENHVDNVVVVVGPEKIRRLQEILPL
jgi:hypothetical protein